jgi:hypothetical protein
MIRKICYICLFSVMMHHYVNAQEISVPFDTRSTLYKITEKENRYLQLYKGENTFTEAILFQQNDSAFILEITVENAGRLQRFRNELNKNGVSLLRARVDSVLTMTNVLLNQEGRDLLMAATTVAGVSTYAGMTVNIFNFNETRANVATYLIVSGSSFFIPYYLTRNEPISYGQANLVYYSLGRGMLHGVLLSLIVKKDPQFQFTSALGVTAGIGEALAGYHLAKDYKISDGQANLMCAYGDAGMIGAFLLANQLHLVDFNNDFVFWKQQVTFGLVLTSGISGMAIAAQKKYFERYSAGDAEIIKTSAFLGAFIPLSIVDAFNPQDERYYTGAALVCGIAGFYAGHKLVQNQQFAFTHGFLTELGTIAGSLLGAGVGYIIKDDPTIILASSAIGGVAGYGTLFSKFKKETEWSKRVTMNYYPANYFIATKSRIEPRLLPNLPLATLTVRL